jgi:hypothetical protein
MRRRKQRRNPDKMPAGLSLYERQKWMKAEAEKSARGDISEKFGLKYEEWPGRWTYRFFSKESKRAAFIKMLDVKFYIL